jgi:hypothetical protein
MDSYFVEAGDKIVDEFDIMFDAVVFADKDNIVFLEFADDIVLRASPVRFQILDQF